MENENVIGKVCFAILRKGFVAGLRISLELDSPGGRIGVSLLTSAKFGDRMKKNIFGVFCD